MVGTTNRSIAAMRGAWLRSAFTGAGSDLCQGSKGVVAALPNARNQVAIDKYDRACDG